MSQAAQHYTAAEIARALQSVRADGLKIVCGQSIAAWFFVALPLELQTGLVEPFSRLINLIPRQTFWTCERRLTKESH